MEDVVRIFGNLLLLGSFPAAGLSTTNRLIPEASFPLKCVATGIVSTALMAIFFYALIALGVFQEAGVIVVGILLWFSAFIGDRSAFADLWREFETKYLSMRKNEKWLVWFLGACVFLLGVRHAVLPPLAWDSLQYHLVRAALWTKSGTMEGYLDFDPPGAWQYYRYFDPVGDIVSAWAMSLASSDVLVPLVFGAFWLLLGAATYSVARSFSVDRDVSILTVIATLLTPFCVSHAFTAYVDIMAASLCVAAVALIRQSSRENPNSMGLMLIGLATALVVKKTAGPFVLAGAIIFVYDSFRRGAATNGRTFAFIGLAALVAAPPLAYVWTQTGNPLYPFGTTVLGVEWLAPAEPVTRANLPRDPLFHYLKVMFVTGFGEYSRHINLGWFFPIVLLIAPVAWGRRLLSSDDHNRVYIAGYVATALVLLFLIAIVPKQGGDNHARFAATAVALAWIGVSLMSRRLAIAVLTFGLFVHLTYIFPPDWGPVDLEAMGVLAVASSPIVALAFAMGAFIRRRSDPSKPRLMTLTFGVMFMGIVSIVLSPVRDIFRYDAYQAAMRGETLTNHVLGGSHGLSIYGNAAWQLLDQEPPSRVAVTAGWDGKGHNWFIYPLFGSRLEHDLTYVTPSREKESAVPRQGPFSYELWVERLEDERVDFVMTMAPRTVERSWIAANPDSFEMLYSDELGNGLFRFRDGESQ